MTWTDGSAGAKTRAILRILFVVWFAAISAAINALHTCLPESGGCADHEPDCDLDISSAARHQVCSDLIVHAESVRRPAGANRIAQPPHECLACLFLQVAQSGHIGPEQSVLDRASSAGCVACLADLAQPTWCLSLVLPRAPPAPEV
jgi:hypothetical protein